MNWLARHIVAIGGSAAMLVVAPPSRAQQQLPGAAEIVNGNGIFYRVPAILPQGARVTFVAGNPYLPEPCTVEFLMPNGYTLPPHTNPAREHVTIKSGTLRAGLGTNIDRRKSLLLVAGDTASTPMGVPHWSIAEGEVDVIVSWDAGPMGIAYMSRRDEPVGHSFPAGY